MTVANILQQAALLSVQERKELVKLLVDTLDTLDNATPRPKHSILELAGLGREIWTGIDAQDYVNQLRNEWDDRP